MKALKIIVITFAITLASVSGIRACEICGCGTGNFYLGMVPKFNSKFIGVRYRTLSYRTYMQDSPSEFSKDNYKTMEVWGGWNLGKKWQMMTFIPYQMNQRITDDGDKYSSGLGDITVLTNYKVWSNGVSLVSQQFWVGAGVKLATGHYKIDFSDPENNLGDPNGQTGTGSTDLLLNANHSITYWNWGLNTTANYKINSANADQFKFGNRFSVNMLAYHRFTAKSFNIAPAVGAFFERSAGNSYKDQRIELTGGHAVFASTGLEMSYKKIAMGISVQSPLSQNYAAHQTVAKARGLSHLTFTF